MLSPLTLHRYIVVLLTAIAAVALALIEVHERSPFHEIFVAVSLGWLIGQLLRWEPPR